MGYLRQGIKKNRNLSLKGYLSLQRKRNKPELRLNSILNVKLVQGG